MPELNVDEQVREAFERYVRWYFDRTEVSAEEFLRDYIVVVEPTRIASQVSDTVGEVTFFTTTKYVIRRRFPREMGAFTLTQDLIDAAVANLKSR